MTTIETMIGNSITNSGIFMRETSHYIIDHAHLYTNYAYDQMSASIPVIQNYAAITNIYVAEKQSQAIAFLTPLLIASFNFLQQCVDSTQATALYYHKRNPDLLAFSVIFSITTMIGISVADYYFLNQLHKKYRVVGEDVPAAPAPAPVENKV